MSLRDGLCFDEHFRHLKIISLMLEAHGRSLFRIFSFFVSSLSYLSETAWKGVLPVSSSYQMTPKAKMSERGEKVLSAKDS